MSVSLHGLMTYTYFFGRYDGLVAVVSDGSMDCNVRFYVQGILLARTLSVVAISSPGPDQISGLLHYKWSPYCKWSPTANISALQWSPALAGNSFTD